LLKRSRLKMLSGGGKKETVSPERRIVQVAEGGKGVLASF
jgi:hypothetical protein